MKYWVSAFDSILSLPSSECLCLAQCSLISEAMKFLPWPSTLLTMAISSLMQVENLRWQPHHLSLRTDPLVQGTHAHYLWQSLLTYVTGKEECLSLHDICLGRETKAEFSKSE